MSKTERIVGYLIVVCAFVAVFVVLVPRDAKTWREAVTTQYFTYEYQKYSVEEALTEIVRRSEFLMWNRGNLPLETVHSNLILVNQFQEFGPDDPSVQIATRQLARLNMDSFTSQKNYKALRWELSKLQQSDPAWRAMRNPSETIWHWSILRDYAVSMFPFSMLFMVIGFIGLLRLWGLVKLAYVAGCALSFLISTAGGAAAQTIKKSTDEKKRKVKHTLQIDARTTIYISEGPSNPTLFLRVTDSGQKFFLESVSIYNPRTSTWATDAIPGLWISGSSKTKVVAMGLFSKSSLGPARLGAGVQIFRSGKYGLLAVPVLRWEFNINGPSQNTFNFVTNPNIKLERSRWSIAPDVGLRKTAGRPWTWSAGAGLRFTPNGKYQIEQGILTNQNGLASLRPRFMTTLAY